MTVIKKKGAKAQKVNAGYEPHYTDIQSIPTDAQLNDTVTSTRGLVEEETKQGALLKISPSK